VTHLRSFSTSPCVRQETCASKQSEGTVADSIYQQVYACQPGKNAAYKFRESIPLGVTSLSPHSVKQVLSELKQKWDGESYDLLTRNCCHFCEEFVDRLGVGPIPTWVNQLARHGFSFCEWSQKTSEYVYSWIDSVSAWWSSSPYAEEES